MGRKELDLDRIRAEIAYAGYYKADVGTAFDERELVQVAQCFGTPRKALRTDGFVDRLMALPQEQGFPNSLTARYGLGEFPVHTDDAVEVAPPRWLLLCNVSGGEQASTTLVDSRELVEALSVGYQKEIGEAVFYFRNGANSFTAPILNTKNGIVRFDLSVMRPTGPRSGRLLETIVVLLRRLVPLDVTWGKPALLFLDNHRMLHGRRALTGTRNGGVLPRVLLRVLVQEVV